MKELLFYIQIMLMVAATVLTTGCIRDDYDGDLDTKEDVVKSLYIRFRMNLDNDRIPGSRAAAASRSGVSNEVTPGTNNENAINKVNLLVYDADTDTLMNVVYLTEQETKSISSPEGACVPVIAKNWNRVRIYCVVNIPEMMRDRLIIGQGRDLSYSTTSNGNSYVSVMNEYVPGSDGKQTKLETLDKGGIPMTGQFFLDNSATGDDVITITGSHDTEETALSVTANLSRLVAKIHVLAMPADDGTQIYASALYGTTVPGSTNTENRIGWIRLENIRYIPNGINKSTYILPQGNSQPGGLSEFKDLNMNLENYVSAGKFASLLWSDDYVYIDGNRIHSANVNSVMETAEKYDAGRLALTLGSSDPSRYVKGMYSPENYFDMPTDEVPFKESQSAIPMITTVVIAAKLTPRVILIEKNFKKEMDDFVYKYENNRATFLEQYQLTGSDFTNEDVNYWKEIRGRFDNLSSDHGCLKYVAGDEKEALYIVNSSLKMHGRWSSDMMAYETGKYSDGTYYVYDRNYDGVTLAGERYLCLTAGAVSEAGNEHVALKSRSVPHIGGWGYYYTYINNNGSANDNGKAPYTASQVTRNSYYIITVNNFSVPGGTISSPDYIKVNTDKVGWDYSGRGDIYLH